MNTNTALKYHSRIQYNVRFQIKDINKSKWLYQTKNIIYTFYIIMMEISQKKEYLAGMYQYVMDKAVKCL